MFQASISKALGLGKNPKKDRAENFQIIYNVLSPSILSAKSETRTGHLLPPILQLPKYSVMSALMAALKVVLEIHPVKQLRLIPFK